ncbi:acyl-coenzyme A thioesterase 2, mitochondrial-like [Polyodon spathula]|uniref:acyl-coenzyme A thioesterase 2, mitochondrial-like n=1 Tax=Polyodon spathula TaxID=7913 RepID=UPI001B7EAAC7|nr:acyl-coenzyme A thioesterase 2, mitochondrial-like [Polyodon spathula]
MLLADSPAKRRIYQQSIMMSSARERSKKRPTPLLRATPTRALVDEPIEIAVLHLPPNRPITLRASLLSERNDLWESYSHYVSDEHGAVRVSWDESHGGSYTGCEPMGLFWSLHTAPGSREGLRKEGLTALRKRNVETPFLVELSVLEDHVADRFGEQAVLAAVSLESWYLAPGVRQRGVVGTLFLPLGTHRSTTSTHGFTARVPRVHYCSYHAALLASRGYASLALVYIYHRDLPGPPDEYNMGQDYYQTAFSVLQSHPQVCADRVGILGISFGSVLALKMASEFPKITLRCVIGVNGPSCIQFSSLKGSMMEQLEMHRDEWVYDEHGNVSFKNTTTPSLVPAERKLKVERIRCPMMLVVGEDDQCNASVESADVL